MYMSGMNVKVHYLWTSEIRASLQHFLSSHSHAGNIISFEKFRQEVSNSPLLKLFQNNKCTLSVQCHKSRQIQIHKFCKQPTNPEGYPLDCFCSVTLVLYSTINKKDPLACF
uniref:Uncharacterized protein n=1 Tax=Opuntia streptacantha TaxID=393608 RepID=A0A7C9DWJ2_OPUST